MGKARRGLVALVMKGGRQAGEKKAIFNGLSSGNIYQIGGVGTCKEVEERGEGGKRRELGGAAVQRRL
jgi:hypothetical protein